MIGYKEREELPQSALEIEKAQAQIKYIVKKGVFNNIPFIVLDGIIGKVVADCVNNIQDEELKKKARKSLLDYATITYRKLSQDTKGINLSILAAIATLLTPYSATFDKAKETVLKAVPNLGGGTPYLKDTPYIEIAQPLNTYAKEYMEQVEDAFRELSLSEAKDSYSDRVSLRNVCEMTERWNAKQEDIQNLIDDGEDLVYISTHANCSERCQDWQGKLYSISGKTGTIDGISYQPLSNATDIYVTTKSGKVYKNGCISGFNCRHTLQPYRKGIKPYHVDAKTIEKYREINDTQRAMEREIRQDRALYIGLKGINDKASKAFYKKAKAAVAEYKKYSEKNKVAYYPDRCRVFDGEELLNPKYVRILEQYKGRK